MYPKKGGQDAGELRAEAIGRRLRILCQGLSLRVVALWERTSGYSRNLLEGKTGRDKLEEGQRSPRTALSVEQDLETVCVLRHWKGPPGE